MALMNKHLDDERLMLVLRLGKEGYLGYSVEEIGRLGDWIESQRSSGFGREG